MLVKYLEKDKIIIRHNNEYIRDYSSVLLKRAYINSKKDY